MARIFLFPFKALFMLNYRIMVDIPFSYYLCYSECKDYINLSLYEVANTIKGPVISRSYLILLNIRFVEENIFESNTIVSDTYNSEGLYELYDSSSYVIELSRAVFDNLKEKFDYIITDSPNTFHTIKVLINNLKSYLKKIGLIK